MALNNCKCEPCECEDCKCDNCECDNCECDNCECDNCECDNCECDDCNCPLTQYSKETCPCVKCCGFDGSETTTEAEESESESEITSSTEEESDDEFDEESTCILRGKWVYDGSKTIDEMINALQKEIDLLSDLKSDGWTLVKEVHDDHAYLVKEADDA